MARSLKWQNRNVFSHGVLILWSLVVILSLALLLLVSSLASYALANWRGKISRALYFIRVAGMMLPIKIASIRILELIRALGLLNTIWSLIPIYVAMGVPVAIFILTEFIRQVPFWNDLWFPLIFISNDKAKTVLLGLTAGAVKG
jgi:raffinose/stachyose/melibiose transport system permease protein